MAEDPLSQQREYVRVARDHLRQPAHSSTRSVEERSDGPPTVEVAHAAKVNVARGTGQELRTACYNRPMRLHDYSPRPAHIQWLLDADPAIRWQVMNDLTDEAPDVIAAERSRIATEGWGAQLLAAQRPASYWGDTRKWDLVTLNSLVALKDLGLDPASKQARKMVDRIDKRLLFTWLNNRPYFDDETEPCINGRILGLGAYFKEPNDALAKQLLDEQLEDGGWNCEAWPFLSPKRPPSRCSSFHTTICVLEGLLDYERAGRKSAAVTKARQRAPKIIFWNAACSARFAPAKSSTSAGCASRSRRFGITTSCADSIICGMQESSQIVASVMPSKV